jgi:hypothetical protein
MLEYAIGQGYSALDAQAHRDQLDGYAVADGLAVSVDSGLTLSVASGTATVGETSGSVDTAVLGSSTTIALDAADSTNPRKDTIYIDTGGTVQKETGIAEPAAPTGATRDDTYEPEPPFPSTDGTILAEVWVPAGASSLSSGDIRDRRVPADVVADRGVFQTVDADDAAITTLQDEDQNLDYRFNRIERDLLSSDESTIQFTDLSPQTEYKLFFSGIINHTTGTEQCYVRFNGDGATTGNYDYFDQSGTKQLQENQIPIIEFSDALRVWFTVSITTAEVDGGGKVTASLSDLGGFVENIDLYSDAGGRRPTGGLSSLALSADSDFAGGNSVVELWERDYS